MIYTYEHPETKERVDIEQGMNDDHIFVKDGIQWNRVFYVPNAFVTEPVNAFSETYFLNKTKNSGTLGDLYDRAAELSDIRAEKSGGIDPIKEKAKEDYSKARGGRKPLEKSKNTEIIV